MSPIPPPTALPPICGLIKGLSCRLVIDRIILAATCRFTGGIDTNPAGFTRFEARELDGEIGQLLYIRADDFTLAPVIADGDLAPRAVLTV